MLVVLLKDAEAEVKTNAINKLPQIGALNTAAERSAIVAGNVIPNLSELVTDAFVNLIRKHICLLPRSQYVRAALASVVMQLSPLVGKEKTIELLVPLFGRLLKDEVRYLLLNEHF